MPPSSIRVYVNATAVDLPAGATAIDAVRAWRAEAAHDVDTGARVITDSRGLPVGGDTPAFAGSIFRVVSHRERTSDGAAAS
jgi:hypothetical protein